MSQPTLNSMVEKIAKVFKERAKVKKEKVYIEAIGEELEFHSLTDKECIECNSAARGDKLDLARRIIYNACEELSRVAVKLVEKGTIGEYIDVVDLFSEADKMRLINLVNQLSGRDGVSRIKIGDEIEAIKNS